VAYPLKYVEEAAELSLRSIIPFFRIVLNTTFKAVRVTLFVRFSLLDNSSLSLKARIYYNEDISIPRVIKDYNS